MDLLNDVSVIVEKMFGIVPTETQKKIIEAILYKKTNHLVIKAMTRYGKSFILSIAALLYIMCEKDKRVLLIGPTYNQTGIIRNHVSDFIVKSNYIRSLVDTENSGIDRLRKEVSKSRITFKNGCELRVLSAEGTAERLMGFGGDLVLVDESPLIADEVFRMRILRMLGDHPEDAILVEIGNPLEKNHFYDSWRNTEITDESKFHIDWKLALKEGRTSQRFINKQRKELTNIEFKVLYDADFPEDLEDTLIRWKWIQSALNSDEKTEEAFDKNNEEPKIVYGLDIAEMGTDKTVLTKVIEKNGNFIVKEIWSWEKKDTMQTASMVMKRVTERNSEIRVDCTGVGRGVYDRLKELDYNAIEIKVGESSDRDSDRYQNKKADFFWQLRKIFEDGRISIPKNKQLVNELSQIRHELTTSKKIKIIDPGEKDASGKKLGKAKSPDFADSLMLACASHVVEEFCLLDDDLAEGLNEIVF